VYCDAEVRRGRLGDETAMAMARIVLEAEQAHAPAGA
jgi:hypothetical protein